jgi:hypothetical protein
VGALDFLPVDIARSGMRVHRNRVCFAAVGTSDVDQNVEGRWFRLPCLALRTCIFARPLARIQILIRSREHFLRPVT